MSAAIPEELRPIILDAGFRSVSSRPKTTDQFDGADLRYAIRERLKLHLTYQDQNGSETDRVIWPLFIAYLDKVRVIVAWCETRQDFRHFRTDRVHTLIVQKYKYPTRRAFLIRQWEEAFAKHKLERFGTDPQSKK